MMRGPPLVLTSLLIATLSPIASAQIAGSSRESLIKRVRQALTQIEVTDEAVLKAQEIFAKKIPVEQREEELKKLQIQQQWRLLVSGVAVAPREIVTRSLHPRAELRVLVTFRNGKQVRGEVIGNDPRSNLALIRTQVDAPGYLAPSESPVVRGQMVDLIGHQSRDGFDADGIVTRLHLDATCDDISTSLG